MTLDASPRPARPARRVPNIVELYGAFEDASHFYIVMEYCAGAGGATACGWGGGMCARQSAGRNGRCAGPEAATGRNRPDVFPQPARFAPICPAGGDLLEKLLKEKRAISERRVAITVAIPCLVTLRHLHTVDIIHRQGRRGPCMGQGMPRHG